MSGRYWYPLAVALLCVVGAHGYGYAKAGTASKGNAPSLPSLIWGWMCLGHVPLLLMRISSKLRLPVPFCQLKDSASRRGKAFCIPLGLNPRYQGVWGMLSCRRQSPGCQLRGDTRLCGKWHGACSVPFQSPSCQECRRLQVTAQEERLGCEWMHEHGFWLKYLINVEVPPVNINIPHFG